MIEINEQLDILIEQCRKKNRKAQFEIYHLYFKAMYNTSCRIIGDIHTAEDITQEAFLSAFDNIKKYKGNVAFGAWLKKIVINKSIDFLRKRKVVLEFEENMLETEVIEEPPFDDYETGNLLKQVKQSIAQLPEGYKMVTTLYLLEGYDYDEIGEILKIKSSTVRSQFTRAKRRLFEIIKKKKQQNG